MAHNCLLCMIFRGVYFQNVSLKLIRYYLLSVCETDLLLTKRRYICYIEKKFKSSVILFSCSSNSRQRGNGNRGLNSQDCCGD